MKKLSLKIFIILIIVLITATIGGSFYMLSYSLSSRSGKVMSLDDSYRSFRKKNPELIPWLDSLQHNKALRDTFITMTNGERQHAVYLFAPEKTGRTAVLIHGYKNNCIGKLHIAHLFQKLGYNVLLPDLHGHGRSDGDNVQMGWKDRIDVMRWMAVADSLFRDSTGTTQMVLHGTSMGAATVMCVSGEHTPNYVKCFIEDCGYTSVWDEFHYELHEMFGLPDFPLMYTTSALCKMKYGWTFEEASPLKQVAKCRKPMLFIHGDNDDFVPSWMVHPLYAAKPQPKEIFIGKGSAHTKCYFDHKTAYVNKVKGFVEKYVSK